MRRSITAWPPELFSDWGQFTRELWSMVFVWVPYVDHFMEKDLSEYVTLQGRLYDDAFFGMIAEGPSFQLAIPYLGLTPYYISRQASVPIAAIELIEERLQRSGHVNYG